jgi:dihydropteroate synthase
MKLIRSTLDLESRVQVMGVLNLTPDSFSDGGQFNDLDRAIVRALEIESEGADLLDIGGESTRPGSKPVSAGEEIARVLPVIEQLGGRLRIPISIDTTKSEVARAAIGAGAEIINDISGLRFDTSLAEIATETGAGIVLMHSRGTPETMHRMEAIDDIFAEVNSGLRWAIDEADRRGVKREKIILDPGIGFGKTPEQNLQLINGLDWLVKAFGLPVMLGASRKSFIKRTLDRVLNAQFRDDMQEGMGGTAASVTIGVMRGARIVRVHDVSAMVAVVRLTEAAIRGDLRFEI